MKTEIVAVQDIVDYFLAFSLAHMLRPRMEQVNSLLQQAPTFTQVRGRFRFEDELNLLR